MTGDRAVTGYTAVVNPAAGRGTGRELADRMAAALGGDVEVVAGTGREDAHALAFDAAGRGRTVLAVGGDGHAGCVADAVVTVGGVLGLVPVGRGNDFARQLGLPLDPEVAATVFRAGRTRTVDVLTAVSRGGTPRTVLGSVYAGVDSVATAIVNSRPPVPGPLVYPYGAVRALLTSSPAWFSLVLDGRPWAERGWSVVVANSGFYGAGMHIVPTAAVDDGELDVLLLRDSARWRLVASLRQVYAGTHLRRRDVEVRRARQVELAVEAVPVYGDGEPLGESPVTVSVRPGALRVLVP